jgi:predicted metal-binding protein
MSEKNIVWKLALDELNCLWSCSHTRRITWITVPKQTFTWLGRQNWRVQRGIGWSEWRWCFIDYVLSFPPHYCHIFSNYVRAHTRNLSLSHTLYICVICIKSRFTSDHLHFATSNNLHLLKYTSSFSLLYLTVQSHSCRFSRGCE